MISNQSIYIPVLKYCTLRMSPPPPWNLTTVSPASKIPLNYEIGSNI